MLGEMVTRPGGGAGRHNPFFHSSFDANLATRPYLSRLVFPRPFPLIGEYDGEDRRSPQVSGDVTNVVLPHNLLQACEDGFDMVIHELGTENAWHRYVFGDKESVEDLGASNIYV